MFREDDRNGLRRSTGDTKIDRELLQESLTSMVQRRLQMHDLIANENLVGGSADQRSVSSGLLSILHKRRNRVRRSRQDEAIKTMDTLRGEVT